MSGAKAPYPREMSPMDKKWLFAVLNGRIVEVKEKKRATAMLNP
jgi:hypothetical protein